MNFLNVQFLLPNDPATWAGRIEAACRVAEAAFGGPPLNVARSMRPKDPPTILDDRPAYLAKKSRTRRRWFSLSAAPQGHALLGGGSGAGHPDADTLLALPPLVEWPRLEAWFVATADAVQAWSAVLDPPVAAARLARLQWGFAPQQPLDDVTALEARLPKLRYVAYAGLPHPAQATRLGWLNYWSEETARRQRFPEQARDGEWNATRTPAGGWLLRLTDEPLDPRRDGHAARLLAGYERFRDFPFAPAG